MSSNRPPKLGDVGTLLRTSAPASAGANTAAELSDATAIKRQLLADFCRLAAGRLRPDTARPPHPLEADLPPRVRQTLQALLTGDSEKQIAAKLGLSRHTVHVYVKTLHKRFGVSSRGELLAKWVQAK